MRTIHCSGRLSCHTCPLPTTHTHCHAYPLPHMPACHTCCLPCTCPLSHMPPCHKCLPATHAPCHAHVPYHTCSPAMHAPPPPTVCVPPPATHTPSIDRILDTRLWKHNLSATTVADGNSSQIRSIEQTCLKHVKFRVNQSYTYLSIPMATFIKIPTPILSNCIQCTNGHINLPKIQYLSTVSVNV